MKGKSQNINSSRFNLQTQCNTNQNIRRSFCRYCQTGKYIKEANKLNTERIIKEQTYSALRPQSSAWSRTENPEINPHNTDNDLPPTQSKRYNRAQKVYFANNTGTTKHLL
jgi:arylsulfatase A-like enzyme